MIDVAYLSKLYAEKLLEKHDHQAAFLKAVWVAYKQGIKDATNGPNELLPTYQPGENTAGPSGAVTGARGQGVNGPTPDTELSEVGNAGRVDETASPEKAANKKDGPPAQLGPHYSCVSPPRLRFDRTTKLTRRT